MPQIFLQQFILVYPALEFVCMEMIHSHQIGSDRVVHLLREGAGGISAVVLNRLSNEKHFRGLNH